MSATPSFATVPAVRRFDPRLVVALLSLWLVWGSTYLAMRIGVASLPPLGMAGTRYLCAAAVMFAIARARGAPMPSRRAWLFGIPIGALLFLVGNGLVVVAEQAIPSSLAAVVCATTPLLVAGLLALRGERPARAEVLGMALGLGGVVLLALGSPLAHAGLRGVLVLFAPVGWALGSILARAERESGIGVSAAHMATGGAWLLLASVVMGEHVPAALPLHAVVAWAWLVVMGSIVGFTAYMWLLRNARPPVALSYAYVNPVVAALLGALLGGEGLGWATALATVLIASGVMAVVVRRK